jgi:type I restriction enzyme S subunit
MVPRMMAPNVGMRTQVSKGDILIVIYWRWRYEPRTLDRELGEAYVSQHIALIKPTDTALSPWLLPCLIAPMGGRAELVERAPGAGKPGLNLDDIRSLPIPPPPLGEQLRIVAKVDELMRYSIVWGPTQPTQDQKRNLLEAILHHALNEDFAQISRRRH